MGIREVMDFDSVFDQDAIRLLLQDAFNRESGHVIPDTIGMDFYFLQGFINEEMKWDFVFAEQDFLKNCFSQIKDYEMQTSYGADGIRDLSPDDFTDRRVLTLMYNGARSGDSFCKELILYLFKTYFKQEYKQLKRFRKIGVGELFSLCRNEENSTDLEKLGRIMGMCHFMDIELEDKCSVLYLLLEEKRSELLDLDAPVDHSIDDKKEYELFLTCREQVRTWMAAEDELPYHKQNKVYWNFDRFVRNLLERWEFPEDYVYRALDSYQGLEIQYARTLKELTLMYPKRTFTFEQVQQYAQLYTLTSFGTRMAELLEDSVDDIFGKGVEAYYNDIADELLYKPKFLSSAGQKKKEETAPVTLPKSILPVSELPDRQIEDYQREIDTLRKKLKGCEEEIAELRNVYRINRRLQEQLDTANRERSSEKDELHALREFVYHLEHEDVETADLSEEEMKAVIRKKKIAIIGGHINWLKKLKAEFPDWKLLGSDITKTADTRILNDCEMVFFFSEHISHSAYYRYIAAVREKEIPFSYIKGVHMTQVVQQIYKELQGAWHR